MNQRWAMGRASYRPAGEVIDTAQYEIASISQDRVAKGFVIEHHYSATYPAARFRYGIYHRAALVGVAVFSHPCRDQVLTGVFPVPAIEAVELGRFVLLDSVPGNGETWFLGQCFRHLHKAGIVGVVSFSDPVARTSLDGRRVFPGHVGGIYQAHNGVYLGRGKARAIKLLPNGQVLSDRAISKIRGGEQGIAYAMGILKRHGARELLPGEAPADWLKAQIAALTRPLRHGGNHKYAWALDKRLRKVLPATGKYPKQVDSQP